MVRRRRLCGISDPKASRTTHHSWSWHGNGPQPFMGHNSFAFLDRVDAIGRQIVQSFGLAGGPENVYAIQAVVGTETKVDSEVVLRQITSTAADLVYLYELSR